MKVVADQLKKSLKNVCFADSRWFSSKFNLFADLEFVDDIAIFFDETFRMNVNMIINKIKICSFHERYRAQTESLDRIIQSNIILEKKIELFWIFVQEDSESWKTHHSDVQDLTTTFSVISKIINNAKRTRNAYQKT
jgi:hypothetical protein